ncbi:MAG TPA: mannose-6-phosphate isomerase, class I [Micromonosporaceae bacterium]
MERLVNPVRQYDWGSRTVIAALLGRPTPSPGPEAELWMGAHPSDPSSLVRPGGPVSLATAIEADPAGMLGAVVAKRFGARLPYLFKVLAAERPLSLQAHPDAERAAARHAAGDDNYLDPYHKPELLVALTEFDGLCGFRDPAVSAAVLAELRVPALDPVIRRLSEGSVGERLRGAVTALLTWPEGDRKEVVAEVGAAARDRTGRPEYEVAARLADQFPADLGVVVALLLNHVRLAPGEAIWMPAGNLHAYLGGTGVEIMAASDNVLRGGLTSKRIDVAELLRVLRFEVFADPVVRPVPVRPGVLTWSVPVEEFALVKATVTQGGPAVDLPGRGPRIVLCVSGSVEVATGGERTRLGCGESVFLPGDAPCASCAGTGEVFQAAVDV